MRTCDSGLFELIAAATPISDVIERWLVDKPQPEDWLLGDRVLAFLHDSEIPEPQYIVLGEPFNYLLLVVESDFFDTGVEKQFLQRLPHHFEFVG